MISLILVTIFVTTFDDYGITAQTNNDYKAASVPSWSTMEIKYNETDNCSSPLQHQNGDFEDLRRRNCMCDEQCVIYDDCCEDSTYKTSHASFSEHRRYEEKFTCVQTAYDGFIYMIHKCPSNYANKLILEYCERYSYDTSVMNRDRVNDITMFTPITSETENITYRNMFCALCHSQTEFKFWHLALSYATIVSSNDSQSLEISLEESSSSEKIHYADGGMTEVISRVDNSTYKRYVNAIMPTDVGRRVRFCPHADAGESVESLVWWSALPEFVVDLNSTLLQPLIVNHCDYLPVGNTGWELLCGRNSNRKILALKTEGEPDIESCFFKTSESNGKLCMINKKLKEGADFVYVDSYTIAVKKYGVEFKSDEWFRQSDRTVFLCGTKIPYSNKRRRFFQQIIALMTEVLVKLSIAFLVPHLMLSSTGSKLKILPNKIMFSYSITLFVVYITWEMALRLYSSTRSCTMIAVVQHYLCLCCFAWLLIASYDCWLVVCRTSQKFQNCARKTRTKRYLCYCFWGWISPLSVMALALYLEWTPTSVIPCDLKPGYGRKGQCFITQEIPYNYFYQYPSAAVTCLNIVLFLRTSYQIFSTKRKGISSTVQNNSYVTFIKLSLNMGIVAVLIMICTIYILVTETDYIIFHLLQHIFEGSQGIFMFFAFSFDRKTIHEIVSKLKR